ncbi:MAG: zf-HC2 domain-containing protein [Myxococcota bacterium]
MTEEWMDNAWDHSDACPPEWMLSFYVDRELEEENRLRAETHLVHCVSCRERVLALDFEADALRAALSLEDQSESAQARAPLMNGETTAAGAGAAVAVGATSLFVLGWLFAAPWPAAFAWLSPLDGRNLFALFFDTLETLRNEGPALFQFTIAAIALVSTAFLMTTSLSLILRRVQQRAGAALTLAAIGFAAISPSPSSALEVFFDQESLDLPAGETVEDSWIVTGDSLRIDGTLRGDLVVFGDRLVIAGTVDGNVISGARRIEISGHVTGSILAFGERVQISGQIDQGALAAAGQTTLGKSGRIGNSLVALGDGLLVSGDIERDLFGYLEWLELEGKVERSVVMHIEQIDILANSRVGGDLEIHFSEDEERIAIDGSAEIGGETRRMPDEPDPSTRLDRYGSAEFYTHLVLSLAAAFLSGLVAYSLAPWLFSMIWQKPSDLLKPVGFGFIFVFAVPIGLLLVAITIVGIPIALAGFAAWAAVLYLAKILVASMIGQTLLGRVEEPAWRDFALPLILGLVIVLAAGGLPFVGGLLTFLTLLAGSGHLILRIRDEGA